MMQLTSQRSIFATVCVLVVLICTGITCAAESISSEPSPGVKQSNEGKLVIEHIKATVKKHDDVYEHVLVEVEIHIIRKSNQLGKFDIISIGNTDGIPLGANAGHLPLDPKWTMLVDVSETAEQLKLLFRCSQTFIYAEFSRHDPKINVPEGDRFIKISERFDKQDWKPSMHVNILPDGFSEEGFDIRSFSGSITESGIAIVRKSGAIDAYHINTESITLHGKQIETRPIIWKSHDLESAIVKHLDELMAVNGLRWEVHLRTLMANREIDNEGHLQGWQKRIISSLRNCSFASVYENRVRMDSFRIKKED